MTYAIDNDDVAHTVYLEWTTTPPTEPGYFWAQEQDDGRVIVEAFRHTADGPLFVRSGWDTRDAFEFTHWLGPLPPPEAPKEETKYKRCECGCGLLVEEGG